jgi:hypothetical protein
MSLARISEWLSQLPHSKASQLPNLRLVGKVAGIWTKWPPLSQLDPEGQVHRPVADESNLDLTGATSCSKGKESRTHCTQFIYLTEIVTLHLYLACLGEA